MTKAAKTAVGDMPAGGWIDRFAPATLRPYLRLARLDRPIGTWLLLLPCWWGISLAAPALPDLRLLLLFAVGAAVMRAAGCVHNDIVDRDIDRRVARTRARPVASGAIGVPRALLFLALLLLTGLAILLSFNRFTVLLGVASLPLVAAYPFMKRVTDWPQAWLGLTFNWGALVGWAAATGGLAPAAYALYAAGVLWTLGYDTIYAHQDKEDDALIGVRSTALKLGPRTRPFLLLFYGGAAALLALAGHLAGSGPVFYAGLAAAAAQLLWQAATVDLDDAGDCLAKFRSNRWFGWILFAAIVADRAFL